jgi:crotonobetainyl-CoA:carnitine CoA-transferase CaiB-like acyl-CoA transferase
MPKEVHAVSLPLDGLRVVALEQAVAAPLATRHLADLGADVVKIERPGEGDFARAYDSLVGGLSSWWVWLNGGKRSLAVDLKDERGQGIVAQLIERADVVVQNLGPGAAERLGLGADQLRARHPRLIACTISGFGDAGPYAGRKAYDALVQSEAGVVAITGTAEQRARAGISVVDISTGMYAFSSILAALIQRGRTGTGATIRTTLFDSIGEWMNGPVLQASHGGPYRCGGGQRVNLAVQNEREWVRFCQEVLRHPEIATDPRFARNELRLLNRAALEPLIETILADVPLEECERRLEAAGVAYARSTEPGELLKHPQVVTRNRIRVVHTPAGDVPMLKPPFNVDGWPVPDARVPAVGEHTAELLCELGYAAAEIESLRAAGVVG